MKASAFDIDSPMRRNLIGQVSVFLNGEDITSYCFEFDTDAGYVGLYVDRDRHSKRVNPETGDVYKEIVYGEVSFQLKDTTIAPFEDDGAWLRQALKLLDEFIEGDTNGKNS